jgi:glycosyltransferase involved in cell wall biosynthesis
VSPAPAPDVLVLTDFYAPAYRAGGPVRSLENLVARMGGRLRIRVVASAYDLDGREPLPGIVPDRWQPRGPAQVLYLSDPARLPAVLGEARVSVLYLNSLFSPAFTLRPLLLRRVGRLPRTPVVVAPRGQLYPGALAQKRAKKLAFLVAARFAGLYRGVTWQATSDEEEAQVRRWFGRGARIARAGNLAALPDAPGGGARPPKAPGELRVAFLSRISPKKNLDGALSMLAGVEGRVRFDVWGPPEDRAYAERCRQLARGLPAGVEVAFRGEVAPERVRSVLSGYHLFFLPTHGENYGHAIVEALGAGLPVLVSDRTPWRGLAARRAGWDLPLERPEAFREALSAAVAMDAAEWAGWSRAARALAEEATDDDVQEQLTLQMFEQAAREGRGDGPSETRPGSVGGGGA